MSSGQKENFYDTSVELKEKYWPEFASLIEDQFRYGAQKYAENPNPGSREATDIIVEGFGLGWLLGTMVKYCFRFRNQKREKDLLKIATYCFICWIKCGFHKSESHDTDTAGSEKR